MNNLRIDLKLEKIHCHDEGDGPGNAEPFLWTVFWKVDGETVAVNTDGPAPPFVQGFPTVVGTPGNHGNLGTSDVDEGDDVPIPPIIGEYHTTMMPIPLTTPVGSITEIGGMMGCIVVLMEEDFTSDSAIQRGHEALDSSVRERLAALLGTLSITKPEPTEEDILALSDQVGEAVKNAIADGVSVLSWIAGWGNMDDEVGSAVFRFSHNQLEGSVGSRIPFGRRWDNEGDWELSGGIAAAILPKREDSCCAELRRRTTDLERAVSKLVEESIRRRIREAEFSDSTTATRGRSAATAQSASRAPKRASKP
jgi:hypothetical protein